MVKIPYDTDIAIQTINKWLTANLHRIYLWKQGTPKPPDGWVASVSPGLGAFRHLNLPVTTLKAIIADPGMADFQIDERLAMSLNAWRKRDLIPSIDSDLDITYQRVNYETVPCIVFYTHAFRVLIKKPYR